MKKTFFVLMIMATFLLAACTPAAAPGASQPGIVISKPVVMSDEGSMGGMDMGKSYVGYLQIKNGATADDQLVGVSCDFADGTLHETSMNGEVASMKAISSIAVPAGAIVELKDGGLHMMFMNTKRDLKVGETVNLTLKFKNAGDVSVTATVTAR